MKDVTNRRLFFKTAMQAGLALGGVALTGPSTARAMEPVKRKGAPHFKLSLVGYSFRNYFKETDPAKKITLFDFVDYCADQGFPAAEMTGYYFPKPATDEYLIKLKRHAYLRGVAISGTSVGIHFSGPPGPKLEEQIQEVKKWVDAAALMGAPYVRVFAAAGTGVPLADAQKQCIESIQQCAEYAGTKGIFIGLENDQGITKDAEQTLALIHGVKSEWFGLNLDLGNFHVTDPYADVAKCAPYAINVHCKMEIRPADGKREPADYARHFKILRDVNYQGYIALEYELADGDPYKDIPGWMKKVKEQLEMS